jgi:tetratricopeptide (TPR) repeat protein
MTAGYNIQFDSLLKITETAKDTTLINSLLRIAEIQMHSNKDTAIYYLVKAEKEAMKINFDEGYSKALFMHGNILYFNNDYSDAKDYFNKCLKLAEKTNKQLLKARCLERMASLNLTTDNPHLALKLYFESLVIFEELNDQRGIAKVYNILGVYKTDAGEFDLAETYLKKSLEMHRQLNDKHNIIENKGNLGYLYERIGDLEQAEKTYLDLIPEIQELNDMYALPIIYFNLASMNQNKGKNREALEFLNKAISISEQSNDSAPVVEFIWEFG